jgi:hypothetical protein
MPNSSYHSRLGNRIVIPTGAKRSGGTCCCFPTRNGSVFKEGSVVDYE